MKYFCHIITELQYMVIATLYISKLRSKHLYCIFVTVFLSLVPKLKVSNLTVFENNGTVSIEIERSEGLNKSIVMEIETVDGTALGNRYILLPCVKSQITLTCSWY